MFSWFPQAELDNVSSLLTDVEGKSIKVAKDYSAVESQLQDVQVHPQTPLCGQSSGGVGEWAIMDSLELYVCQAISHPLEGKNARKKN